MRKVSVLDCTLRDGGYCNEWRFGRENITKIIRGLIEANINIIECGFLTQKVSYDTDITKFPTIEDINNVLPKNHEGKLFVCMINFGEYKAEDIPVYSKGAVDGIRVAFHKSEAEKAIIFCRQLIEKGYKVFLQPMAALNYTEEEFIALIKSANEIKPYAFYIVDSFGGMKERELMRLFYMVEHDLDTDIQIGFHSHNNMQLAYSNAKALISTKTKRHLIIDSSIYGMGRGAGNLNTELLIEFLNDVEDISYHLQPVLTIIDQILNDFYQRKYWGYSIPNYLSAKHNAHPNYANFLVNRQTLLIGDMDQIFAMMPDDKKGEYDKLYIEELYYRYMENNRTYEENLEKFKKEVLARPVLIIAPGKSIKEEQAKICDFVKENNAIIISVNFEYPGMENDFIFVSNLRRYTELDLSAQKKCILTSNIPAENGYMKVYYSGLLNSEEEVRDNAGLMLIKFLLQLGVQNIWIAGMDGYSHQNAENYVMESMAHIVPAEILDARNREMGIVLKKFSRKAKLYFVTKSMFQGLGDSDIQQEKS